MARNENLPFPRGQTFFQDSINGINTVDGENLVGKTYVIEDIDFGAAFAGAGSAKPARSGRFVKLMVVRNKSGTTLNPKRVVKMDASTPNMYGYVSGYATALTDIGYPVDEFLNSAVADNDIFYVVVSGPAKVTTAGSGSTTINPGQYVDVTTGGVVVLQDSTATGASLFASIQNSVGHAITAVAAISTDFVINVHPRGVE